MQGPISLRTVVDLLLALLTSSDRRIHTQYKLPRRELG